MMNKFERFAFRHWPRLCATVTKNKPPSIFGVRSILIARMSSEAADRSPLPFFALRRRAVADPTTPSDENLLSRLESGDFTALDSLFDRYAALIFRIWY
jgi:hypothetical protein